MWRGGRSRRCRNTLVEGYSENPGSGGLVEWSQFNLVAQAFEAPYQPFFYSLTVVFVKVVRTEIPIGFAPSEHVGGDGGRRPAADARAGPTTDGRTARLVTNPMCLV